MPSAQDGHLLKLAFYRHAVDETIKEETERSIEGKTDVTPDVRNTNSKTYRCCICNKDYANMPYIIRHIKYHMGKKTDVPQPKQCDYCNKLFTTKQQLSRHVATHKDVRAFKCEQCDKLFKTGESVKRHMYVHSDARPFSCSICSKQFKAKHLMKKHEETHSDEKNHECPKCGKKFKARNSLRDHLLVHNGTRPYKCDECDQAFYRRSHLATHKTTHSEVKPFSCKCCEKSFGRREHLTVHERIHSGEKPFKCDQCDRSFNQQSGLQAHRISHSDERPYTCLKCKKCFKYRSQTRHHTCRPDEIGPCMIVVNEVASLNPTNPRKTADATSGNKNSEEGQLKTPSTVETSTLGPENAVILIQIENTPRVNETAMSVDVVTTHENNVPSHDAIVSTAGVGVEARNDHPNAEKVWDFASENITAISKDISKSARTATNTRTSPNPEISFFSPLNSLEVSAGEKHGNTVVETEDNFSHVAVTERCISHASYVNNTLTSCSSAEGSVPSMHQQKMESETSNTGISDIVPGTYAQVCMGISHGVTVGAQGNSLTEERANNVWPHSDVSHVVRSECSMDESAKPILSNQFYQPGLPAVGIAHNTGRSYGMFSGPPPHLWNRSQSH